MRKTKYMTPMELHDAGVRALIDCLGVGGMIQFIGLFYKGEGDYSRDRHKLLPKESVSDIVARIKKRRAAKKKKPAVRSRK